MDIPAPEKIVVAGPGLSVAAQVATNVAEKVNEATGTEVPNIKPVDVVTPEFVKELGIKTHGWISEGNTWWKRHQNWVWAFIVGTDGFVSWLSPQIPQQYPRLSLVFNIAGVITGKILSMRTQFSVVYANILAEVRRHTQ